MDVTMQEAIDGLKYLEWYITCRSHGLFNEEHNKMARIYLRAIQAQVPDEPKAKPGDKKSAISEEEEERIEQEMEAICKGCRWTYAPPEEGQDPCEECLDASWEKDADGSGYKRVEKWPHPKFCPKEA